MVPRVHSAEATFLRADIHHIFFTSFFGRIDGTNLTINPYKLPPIGQGLGASQLTASMGQCPTQPFPPRTGI